MQTQQSVQSLQLEQELQSVQLKQPLQAQLEVSILDPIVFSPDIKLYHTILACQFIF